MVEAKLHVGNAIVFFPSENYKIIQSTDELEASGK